MSLEEDKAVAEKIDAGTDGLMLDVEIDESMNEDRRIAVVNE